MEIETFNSNGYEDGRLFISLEHFISLFYASWKYQLCLRCFSENSLGEIKENYYISIHTAIKVMQIAHNSSDSALKNLLRNVGVNDIYLFIYF